MLIRDGNQEAPWRRAVAIRSCVCVASSGCCCAAVSGPASGGPAGFLYGATKCSCKQQEAVRAASGCAVQGAVHPAATCSEAGDSSGSQQHTRWESSWRLCGPARLQKPVRACHLAGGCVGSRPPCLSVLPLVPIRQFEQLLLREVCGRKPDGCAELSTEKLTHLSAMAATAGLPSHG
jgi:hypothetical protein